MEDRDLKKLLRYICGLILLAGGILVYDGIRRQNRPASPEPVVQVQGGVSFSQQPLREPALREGAISFTPPTVENPTEDALNKIGFSSSNSVKFSVK